MIEKVLTIEEFDEFQKDIKYGNKIVLNIVMALLVGKYNVLSDDLFAKILDDKEDLEELLFLIPKAKEYQKIIKNIIEKLFYLKGFQKNLLERFLKHFSDSPKILNFYLELERVRINKLNYGVFS